MVSLTELWLPILLSAVFVFVVSSVIHMVLPYHKSDCLRLPGEEKLLTELRSQNIPPGDYAFPRAESMKDMCSPEMMARYQAGPVGFITVMPSGPPAMGKSLFLWFVFSVVVGVFVGYLASIALKHGDPFMTVFRLTGTAAILGYGASHVVDSIWKGHRWANTLKFVFDGVLYGLATGATFAWLWPGSPA
jgi:hypothetical protein